MDNLIPNDSMTEEEWLVRLKHIDEQLTHVLDAFNFLEGLIKLSNESDVALEAFNRNPLFWNVIIDSLQETLFKGVARLCDNAKDVISVSRVLNEAMAHPEFFSREALTRRLEKRGLASSLADHLLGGAWFPESREDLKALKAAISVRLRRIEQIYLPIRGSYYGHRSIEVDARDLFAKTNRTELGETLDTVRQLVGGLRFLYDNGVKPRLDVQGAKALDLESRRHVRDVVRAVAGKEL